MRRPRPDYNDFTPTDFALDESFVKFVNGSDPETDRFWREWLSANPAKRGDVEVARALVLSLRFKDEEVSEEEIKAEWFRLQTRDKQQVERSHPSIIDKFLRIAAVVLLALASTFILYNLPSETDPERPQMTEHHTRKGQKLSLVLPDGTSIILNSGSAIQYPIGFREGSREVHLQGEAFFDVVHDADRPFTVRTNGITTSVLSFFKSNAHVYARDGGFVGICHRY